MQPLKSPFVEGFPCNPNTNPFSERVESNPYAHFFSEEFHAAIMQTTCQRGLHAPPGGYIQTPLKITSMGIAQGRMQT